MKLPILILFAAAAISSPALAQGGGDAGSGNAGSRANYDYSYRFPGDLPQSGAMTRPMIGPSRRRGRITATVAGTKAWSCSPARPRTRHATAASADRARRSSGP